MYVKLHRMMYIRKATSHLCKAIDVNLSRHYKSTGEELDQIKKCLSCTYTSLNYLELSGNTLLEFDIDVTHILSNLDLSNKFTQDVTMFSRNRYEI